MGQVSAMVQVHAHNRIARIADGKLDSQVRLCAGMRLYIGIITAKQLFCPFDRQILHHVHAFASAVISLSRISFRIFIGQRASHRRHDRLAHPVLRCDQLNMAVLPVLLIHDRLRNFRIRVLYFIK